MTWTAADRPGLLDRMAADPLDVLVVGAGITGAGVALDAASRGYRVGMVERADVASGTSSKSSKLVHGGLRYLATGDVAMVLEGVRERERLRRAAPHLVRPLGFVVPTDTALDVAMMRVGLLAYDAMALGRGARSHRRLSQQEVLLDAPGLARGARAGGFRYDDAQTDDARLTLAIVQAARAHGALVVPHAEVVELTPRQGMRPATVQVQDRLGGEAVSLQARWVVGAGGVWADRIGDVPAGTHAPPLRPAKGVHLVFDRRDLAVNRAVVLPSARDDGRRVFLVPWGAQVYLGTTDDAETAVDAGPTVTAGDATYLLDAVNTAFATDLGPTDAIGAWAGWRPLIDTGDAATADLSRRHVVHQPADGVVTVTGGKLTTERQMAEDVVDVLVAGDGIRRRCRTTGISLGASRPVLEGLADARRALQQAGGDPAHAGSLYHRHGDRAPEVVAACASAGELDTLVDGLPYLAGEVRWAARQEMACTLDDVLTRRLRVSLRHAAAGGSAIERAASILAEELGWDAATTDAQVAAYRQAVAAERGVVPLA